MKLLILFLSFLTMIMPLSTNLSKEDIDETQNRFLDSVEKNYSYYDIEKTIDFDEFSLIIVKGIYNDCGCYGISFVPAVSNEYILVLETNESTFTLPSSNYVIAIKADITYDIVIYDKEGTKLNIEKITIEKFNKDAYDTAGALAGLGEGVKFSFLQLYKTKLRYLPVLLISLGIMIAISGSLLLLLFILKKGFFNKDKRKEGVVSMRDIYEAETNDINTDGISFEENEEYFEEKTPNDSSTIIPVINPNKREEDESSVSRVEDIKAYLVDHGFVVDYNILDEGEKNKIMMELIKLKNDGMITMDDYYKETYELWKKSN